METLLLFGAVARLTRLLTTDVVFERLRVALEERIPLRISYMFRCDWCMSMYVGLGVFVAAHYAPGDATTIFAGALTASLLAGWAASLLDALNGWADEVERRKHR